MTTAPAALRAQFRDTIMLRGVDGALAVAPSTAIATLYEVGSDTVLAATIYADESSSHQLPNPVPTGPNGMLEFWLDTERELDIVVTCPGFSTVRATVTADSAGGKLVNPVIEGTIYGTPIWDSPQNITISQPAQPFIDHGTLNQLAVGDPHPQYLTAAEGDALFLTQAEANALYAPVAGGGYLTQAAADTLYVNVAGDTMTGGLTAPSVNTPLLAPTANVIEQRNGTNAQQFRVYNSYVGSNDYSRLGIFSGTTGGTQTTILTEQAGTGVAQRLIIGTSGFEHLMFRVNGTDAWYIAANTAGALVAATDNVADIGRAVSNRPKNIYQAGGTFQSYNPGAGIANDATNYERLSLSWAGNTSYLTTEAAGTGAARILQIGTSVGAQLNFQTNNTLRWLILGGAGHLVSAADNTYNIGQATTQRPANIYQAGGIFQSYNPGAGIANDGTNYERLNFGWTGNNAQLNVQAGGTGLARLFIISGNGAVYVRPGGLASGWAFHQAGLLIAETDNVYDIGAPGSFRPKNIYAGTSVVTPLLDTPLVTTGGAAPLVLQTAASQSIAMQPGGTTKWFFHFGGTLFPAGDNAYDIGLSTNRPRNLFMASWVQQATIVTPASPPAGSLRLYPKSDGNYYKLDSAGVETVLGGGAAANGIPVGGTTGQVLQKNSATNYDAGWVTLAGGGAVPDPLILTQYVRAAGGYQMVDDNHGLYYLGGNVTEMREYGGVWQLRRGIAASGATGRLSLEAQDLFSISGALTQPQIAKPASPAAGYVRIYPKADGQFYRLVSDGTETLIGGGGGGLTLPLGQNLTFSPDNTYDIGTNATTARPRDAFIGRNLQVSGVIGAGMAPVAGQAITIQSNALFAWFDTNHYLQAGSANDMLLHEWGGSWTFRSDFADARAKVRARILNTSFSLYGNWTDASNYERFYLEQAGGGAFRINSGKLGSGLVRDIEIGTADQSNWRFTGGHILAVNDNVSDIGASAATRPRSIYAATSFVGPGAVPTGGTTAQVLQKTSATNYAVGWTTPSDPALRTYVGHVMGGIDAGAAPTLMGGESITTFGVTLFSDSFTRADSTTIGNGWTESGGNWEIVSNAVREPTSSGAAFLLNSPTLSTADYAVQATITQGAMVSTPTTGLGVCARMVDTNNYYLAWILDQGTHVDLYRVQGGTYNLLQEWTQTALADPVILRLECQGTAIRVLVNGVTRISVTDAAFSAAGSIGLRTYAGASFTNHRFDDVQVVDFSAPANSLMVWPGAGGAIGLAAWTDTGGHLLPTASATSDIGSATYQARDLFLSRNLTVGAAATIANGLTVTAGAVNLPSGAVNNAELASDTARANLLTNGSFDVWQRGAGPFAIGAWGPDRWLLDKNGGSTMSVSREANSDTGSYGTYQAACSYTHAAGGDASLIQISIESLLWQPLRGKTVTFSARVYANVANNACLGIYDGVTAMTLSPFNVAGWQTLSVTQTVSASATTFQVRLRIGGASGASDTVRIHNAMLVVGSVAADYAPLHPADDLARCQRYYHVIGETASSLFLGGYAEQAGRQIYCTFPTSPKTAVVPTITVKSGWSLSNTGAIGTGVGADSFALIFSATALGFVTATGNPANAIVLEANP